MGNGLKRALAKYRELITFAAVGAINTGIDFGVFSLALIISGGAGKELAQAIGYTSGLVCSFFLNKYVTFRNNVKGPRQAVLFLLCNGAALAISVGAIYLFHSVAGIQEHIAKLFLVTPVTMVLNFISYKYIVFKKPQINPRN